MNDGDDGEDGGEGDDCLEKLMPVHNLQFNTTQNNKIFDDPLH